MSSAANEVIAAAQAEIERLTEEADGLVATILEAVEMAEQVRDLLLERIQGSSARSAAHNARIRAESLIALLTAKTSERPWQCSACHCGDRYIIAYTYDLRPIWACEQCGRTAPAPKVAMCQTVEGCGKHSDCFQADRCVHFSSSLAAVVDRPIDWGQSSASWPTDVAVPPRRIER